MRRRWSIPRKPARGVLLLEVLAAAALIAVLATLCLQLFGSSLAQRRALRYRQLAMQEAANALERVATRSWEELTPARLPKESLSAEAAKILPQGHLNVEVLPADGPPEGRQLLVSVDWRDGPGQEPLVVRLTAWRYAEPAAKREARP